MEEYSEIFVKRHSLSHVLAAAVKELYGNVLFGIGPAIDNGFYYDFDMERVLTPEDFKNIENKMQEIINQNLDITKKEISKADALKMFKEWISPKLHGERFVEDKYTKIKLIPTDACGVVYQNYFRS